MRKGMICGTLLVLMLTVMLSACGAKADPVGLPAREEISSVKVTEGETVNTYTDKEWIDSVYAVVLEAEPTAIKSVQDVPNGGDYIGVSFGIDENGTTADGFCLYEKDGTCYLEEPYSGVWRVEETLLDLIQAA